MQNNKNIEEDSLQELDKRIENAREALGGGNKKTIEEARVDATRMGVELVSGVLVGAFIGYWLDKWLDTSPLFLILCFFFGVAGGAMNIYRIAKRMDKEMETKK